MMQWLCRSSWTILPMPTKVIQQIHRMARRAKMKSTLLFSNQNNEDTDALYNDIPEESDEPNNNNELTGGYDDNPGDIPDESNITGVYNEPHHNNEPIGVDFDRWTQFLENMGIEDEYLKTFTAKQ